MHHDDPIVFMGFVDKSGKLLPDPFEIPLDDTRLKPHYAVVVSRVQIKVLKLILQILSILIKILLLLILIKYKVGTNEVGTNARTNNVPTTSSPVSLPTNKIMLIVLGFQTPKIEHCFLFESYTKIGPTYLLPSN